MVHVTIDMNLPENQNPKPELEENEFIEVFLVPLADLYAECKRLETEGFVTRHRAADDERRVRVRVTAAGLDLKGPVMAVQREVASQLSLTADEALLLRTLAHRLRGDAPHSHATPPPLPKESP